MSTNRSRAYPAITLEDAYHLFFQISPSLGQDSIERANLARLIGYRSASGGLGARKIAALVHYGFLDRRGGAYALSDFGAYFRSLDQESTEFRRALCSALRRPVLFKELLDKYEPGGEVPRDLKTCLEGNHGITARASGEVERIFVASGHFAAVFDEAGQFVSSGPRTGVRDEVGSKSQFRVLQGSRTRPIQGPEPLEWKIPLSGGKSCELIVKLPLDLTEEDFSLLNTLLPLHAAYIKGLRPPVSAQVQNKKSPWLTTTGA